ncbi:hypothetical protein [Sphaerotilus sp.]|uniref:hypothetical protein n=1 Tax=Sphaerotilus sp. TaxID=2093942 RepID=UPI00286D8859|nr:hypothetical protein [Sphaerotilus sp.]
MASQDCRLSKRHRVLLLLVDGERSLNEVVRLGRQVGVPRSYIDELFALGLIVIGPPVAPAISEFAAFGPDIALTKLDAVGDTIGFGGAMGNTELAQLDAQDTSLAQARVAVLQVLRANAPVFGMVTMIRVRRVRSRAELQALLPEVQARLSRSRPLVEARQLMLRVESLLAVR